METINLFMDGREITAVQGQTILEAALASNIYIPHLCAHPDLPPQGNCSLCVVELDDEGRVVKACETDAAHGMRVRTKSPELTKARNIAMELLLAGHPRDCTSCKAYLNCELQSLMQYLGVVNARMRHIRRDATNINTKNPLIIREMERCIQCGRCVRACRSLRSVDILRYNKLGWETYIGTENDLPLADAGCRFCGACVEVCPTGALLDTEGLFRRDIPRAEALVPCSADCPVKMDIPRYIRYINCGDYSRAVAVMREKAPFPHTLGYVCNRRCETACKREKLNEAISVRELKRFAAERDTDRIWYDKYISPLAPKTGKSVAVIGGGPCGLTAAYYLQKKGHEVTIYEKLPKAGGMMAAVIPEYRVPAGVVEDEVDIIRKAGVTILTDSHIASAAELKKSCDAVLVAVGAGRGKKLRGVPGWDNESVFTAIDVLGAARLGRQLDLGNTVNIIGGGNVAFDCARTLLRMGKSVNIICLEKGGAMLADEEEIREAAEEGADLFDGAVSVRIETADRKISSHRIIDVEDFHFDRNNELILNTLAASERTIPCDSIIFAAGQEPDLDDGFGIELNCFGYPVIDHDNLTTNIGGVFAAGDAVTGTKFIVDAIAAGRKAAATIDRYLGGEGRIDELLIPFTEGNPKIGKIEGFAEIKRELATLRPSEERSSDFKPVSGGLECAQASRESERCLQCDLRKQISKVKLWTGYSSGGGIYNGLCL